MRSWLHFVLVIGCLVLAGCSRKYTVSSNTFVDYQEIPGGFDRGASFCIVSKNNENVLFTREVERKIANLLLDKGYSIGNEVDARYTLFVDFSMSNHTKVINTLKYLPKQTEDTEGKTSEIDGRSTKYKESKETSGQAVYVPETHVFFEKKLTMEVFASQAQNAEVPIWSGSFLSEDEDADLRSVIDYLLVPAFENFGRSTGRAVKVVLDEKDKKVQALRNRL